MGASGRIFLEQREFEGQIDMGLLTKKESISKGKQNAKEIIESGEVDLFKLFSNSVRFEEFLKSFNKEMRVAILEELKDGEYKARGLEFASKNGSSRLNYKEDQNWQELKDKLTQREELLKVAEKSKEPLFDSEGVEVPRVSRSHSGTVLNIRF